MMNNFLSSHHFSTKLIRSHFSTSSRFFEPVFQSNRYSPTIKTQTQSDTSVSSPGHNLLLRAGFLRQSSNGIWNFLPNAIRVLKKVEDIVREEMKRIGASEVSLSHLQTSSLWKASGRWNIAGKELFRLSDRKDAQLLLAPTHEEEITQLVKLDVNSSKQLPVRLFHIGRKYRDELRPRAGLLRSREFIMKDLYTFDLDRTKALETYLAVQGAYEKILKRIGIPFVVAEADSGAIGGSQSHEYQFESPSGEDTVIKCTKCDYMANVELAKSVLVPPLSDVDALRVQFFQASLNTTLLAVVLPANRSINPLKLGKIHHDFLEVKINNATELAGLDERFEKLDVLIDESCMMFEIEELYRKVEEQFIHLTSLPSSSNIPESVDCIPMERSPLSIWSRLPTYSVHDVRQVLSSSQALENTRQTPKEDHLDHCPKCRSPLGSSKAIEVAHTFYLGTKYSSSLSATCKISDPKTGLQKETPFEMGCFGIGISRLMGAIAECSHTETGLRWPINVAPFKVCIIIPIQENNDESSNQIKSVADIIGREIESIQTEKGEMKGEVLIDDRIQRIGWKLMDAELVGYPILILLGNRWIKNQVIEIRDVKNGKVIELENVGLVDGKLLDQGRLSDTIGSIIKELKG